MRDFSYKFYVELVRTLMSALPLRDFSVVKSTTDRFFILRHDVEFSVEKAYEMACIEHDELGINSSYFFQMRNYTYNPFAFRNKKLIEKMYAMGHKIGLHVNTSGLGDLTHIRDFVKNDCALLQHGLDVPVDRFSFHRPCFALLKAGIKIKGLINTYDQIYFHLYEHDIPLHREKYYFSDSEHSWKYGEPLEQLTPEVNKVQLLVHPYSWSKNGLDNTRNFEALVADKYQMMLQEMNSECHNFPQELLKNEKI